MDADAAGHGWFVDPTPLEDELTAVLNELGYLAHLGGLEEGGLLPASLAPGIRRVQAINAVFAGTGVQ
ncbi:MAG: hypothetical protein L0Z62_22515 [Gemmataceae bacterium]|nr:hypothetical protein [Gemmataceae bacterium]